MRTLLFLLPFSLILSGRAEARRIWLRAQGVQQVATAPVDRPENLHRETLRSRNTVLIQGNKLTLTTRTRGRDPVVTTARIRGYRHDPKGQLGEGPIPGLKVRFGDVDFGDRPGMSFLSGVLMISAEGRLLTLDMERRYDRDGTAVMETSRFERPAFDSLRAIMDGWAIANGLMAKPSRRR